MESLGFELRDSVEDRTDAQGHHENPDKQVREWSEFAALLDKLCNDQSKDNLGTALISAFGATELRTSFYRFSDSGKAYIGSKVVPIIHITDFGKISTADVHEIHAYLIAACIVFDKRILRIVAEYNARYANIVTMIYYTSHFIEERLKQTTTPISEKLSATRKEVHSNEESARKGQSSISQTEQKAREALVEEKINPLSEKLDELSEGALSRLDALETQDKLKTPVILFNNLKFWYTIRYVIGMTTIVALVFLVIFVFFNYTPSVVNIFGLTDDTKPLSAKGSLVIAAFAAIATLIGWMFRIIGRFVTNAMAIAEDADYRRAMADSFAAFQKDNSASKDERAIMLAAIFRAPPGQKQEEFEPVQLAVLRDMLGKSDKPAS